MLQLSKKVCVLGSFAVGKTSLVRRFVFSLFDDTYLSTIGVKVSRKRVVLPGAEGAYEMTMMLWDLADADEFEQVRASYLRGATGAVLVCDVTRPATLDRLRVFARELQSVSPGARLVLAANKVDLRAETSVSTPTVKELAAELGADAYFTSAKTGAQVENVFRQLGRLLAGAAEDIQ